VFGIDFKSAGVIEKATYSCSTSRNLRLLVPTKTTRMHLSAAKSLLYWQSQVSNAGVEISPSSI
jgi:hypothetical protein